jgi:DNA repair protein SbcC/Rad50
MTVAGAAARRLSDIRSHNQRSVSLRESVNALATELAQQPLGRAEPLGDAVDRLQKHVATQEEALSKRQELRRAAIGNLQELSKLVQDQDSNRSAILEHKRELERMRNAKERSDERLGQARELARRAREVRTETVRRVFNESLNAVWRDLFVRLAPDEPFVPAFSLPETHGGPVEAVLETIYRATGKGGNPRAMLSAGNLNTAALTLFLALHLSAKPMLPWLVIDDPVQSMDEVHIAQFAALLRSLAKQLHRQIIIAVHEKPLFDYLALELSPAFPNDRLITIELGRTATGASVYSFEPRTFHPDTAIAA